MNQTVLVLFLDENKAKSEILSGKMLLSACVKANLELKSDKI